MVTDINGRRSHSIVADGLTALEALEHRGAAGAEPNSGDGAGVLLQLPVELFRKVVDFELSSRNADGTNTFAAGICFMRYMAQLFLATPDCNDGRPGGIDLDRRVYAVRILAEGSDVYFAYPSSRTIAWKGMLTTMQLPQFFRICATNAA